MLVQQHMPDAAALLLRSAQQLGIYTAKDAVQQDFMVKKKTKKKTVDLTLIHSLESQINDYTLAA